MSTFQDRIKLAFDIENLRRRVKGDPALTKTDLWKAAKTSSGAATHWFNGTNGADLSTCRKIAPLLNVNDDWLFNESKPMKQEDQPSEPGQDFVAVVRVALTLEAGITGYHIQQIEGNGPPIFFRRDFLERKGWQADRLFALKVIGDSMEPALYEGDLVVVNTADTDPHDGEVFAINYEGQAVIKRLRRDSGAWWIDSDNQRHRPKRCDEHAILIGRVCYKQSERI